MKHNFLNLTILVYIIMSLDALEANKKNIIKKMVSKH